MFLFLIPLTAGLAFVGASAFTAGYSRWLGERGGQLITAVLRNILGIPLGLMGGFWAWAIPAPWAFPPHPVFTVLGWALTFGGVILFMIGHRDIGKPSGLPSVRDNLVRHGLYAYVRHPIYAGSLVMLPGLVLIRPSITVLVASAVAFAWLLVQARLEEIDLLQRLPEYREYMREVPRFIPRLRRGNWK